MTPKVQTAMTPKAQTTVAPKVYTAVAPEAQSFRPHHKIPVNPKNPALAEKIQRMLVRKRAKGDAGIPEESRVALHFESAEGEFQTDIFVGDFQAVGVAVDLAARKGRMQSRGLRAKKTSGEELDLNGAVGGQLQSGDTIVLTR